MSSPNRPRKGNRRDQGRFFYYQKKRGGPWYGQRIGGGPEFKASKPRGAYLTRSGRWRKFVRGRNVPAKTPALFRGKAKKVTHRAPKGDAAALAEIRKILNATTPSLWGMRKGKPIKPDLARGTKSIQGFRTVATFTSSRPYLSTWYDVQDAFRAIAVNPTIQAAFANRRTVIHFEFRDARGVWHWVTPSLARNFETTSTQVEFQTEAWAAKYVSLDDENLEGEPSTVIRAINVKVE